MIEYPDKEISGALRAEALIGAGKRSSLLRLAADRLDDNGRSITAGHYTLTRWDDGSYWLNSDETGEGMGMSEALVIEMLDAIWKEY